MNTWNKIPNDEIIKETVEALRENGITTIVVDNAEEAKKKALELIPHGSEVMLATSVTADSIGLSDIINTSGEYDPIKVKLAKMDRVTEGKRMQQLGTAHDYVVGSVHAVTQDGKVIIASNTGSQLPAYAYGATRVIWLVGAQKIVKNLDEGMKRIYDYVLPKESERAHKAYGVPGSFVSKLLIFNREANPERIIMILVKENLGY